MTQEKRKQRLARQRESNRKWYDKKKLEIERQRALEAGEIESTSTEEIQATEQAELAKREARKIEKREYKRVWANQNREKKRAEKANSTMNTSIDETIVITA